MEGIRAISEMLWRMLFSSEGSSGQLVHHVPGGGLDYLVLGKVLWQLPILIQQLAYAAKLALVRQLSEYQKPDHLLKAEAALRVAALNDILYIDASIGQPPFIWYFVPIVD